MTCSCPDKLREIARKLETDDEMAAKLGILQPITMAVILRMIASEIERGEKGEK